MCDFASFILRLLSSPLALNLLKTLKEGLSIPVYRIEVPRSSVGEWTLKLRRIRNACEIPYTLKLQHNHMKPTAHQHIYLPGPGPAFSLEVSAYCGSLGWSVLSLLSCALHRFVCSAYALRLTPFPRNPQCPLAGIYLTG